MELQELYTERRKRIQKFKDEKDLLRIEFKSELDAIDKQIAGKKTTFANKKASTVKKVLGEMRKGKLTKADTYNWNKNPKVQKMSKKKDV
jgi:hypothetical protein